MTAPILAWHFVSDKLRDGRPVPDDGVRLKHDGELKLCRSGLHASLLLMDALTYAPGSICCRVKCGGKIIKDRDKLVCSSRTILWRVDITDILSTFARQCALRVVHLWESPACVVRFLETGKGANVAKKAAWSTEWSFPRDAAWYAASCSAYPNATGSEVRRIARYVAKSAARAVARFGQQSKEQVKQNTLLESLVQTAFRDQG